MQHSSLDNLQLENAELKASLAKANAQIAWFKEQFKLLRQRQFGRQTEKTEVIQLALFDEFEADEVTEKVEPISEEKEQVTYERKKSKKNGRNIDTSILPRERLVHDLPEDKKVCTCGCALEKIGQDSSEQLEFIPAQIKVIEHIRPKYTCRQCETIMSAPKPEQPIAKCLAAASLITEVIIKKYDHHVPLYRQSAIFAQDGIDISDNTLGNWVMQSTELLYPLSIALWEQVAAIHYLQVDETPVKILHPEKKAYMWAYHSLDKDNRFILFDFNLSRASQVVNSRLQNFKGILQTDGYGGYNTLRENPDIVSLGCWDHSRRKFVEAIKICNDNTQGIAGQLLTAINKLYKIERQYKEAHPNQRHQARQKEAKPLLETIFEKASKASVLPKSVVGKAIAYLLNNQLYLAEYIHHPHAQLSNCLVENLIRPFALGRKNWLFVGNEVCAQKSALLYSLIQTCKLNHINPRNYFNYLLMQVHAMRRNEIEPKALLPQFIDLALL
jgi:transposase